MSGILSRHCNACEGTGINYFGATCGWCDGTGIRNVPDDLPKRKERKRKNKIPWWVLSIWQLFLGLFTLVIDLFVIVSAIVIVYTFLVLEFYSV